jgi:hypothetical protein
MSITSVYYVKLTYPSHTHIHTVGYGDLSPHNTAGKVFVMLYIVVGVGIVLGIIASGVQSILESQEAYVLQLGRACVCVCVCVKVYAEVCMFVRGCG